MISEKKSINMYAKALLQYSIQSKDQKKESEFLSFLKIAFAKKEVYASDIFIIGEELILLRAIIINSSKMKNFITNPTILEKKKLNALISIIPGLSFQIKAFLEILCEKSNLYLLPEICDEYNEILLKYRKITKVKLFLSSYLEKNLGKVIFDKLKVLTGSDEVILNIIYSPKLLGGFLLEYNSIVLDASIFNELSQITKKM